jgi:hypothetical protein
MSLKIRKITGEVFDLPVDYVIEAEKNNPLFTDKGSKTVPIHFPNTDNNRKLLLNSDRLDRTERPDKTFRVVVETDTLQQSGLMAINSPFNAGIGFDEAEMYNQMTTMQLRDIPILNDPVNHPEYQRTGAGTLTESKVGNLLNHLTQVMREQVEADYFVFSVILNYEIPDETKPSNVYFDVLNDIALNFDGGFVSLQAMEERTIKSYMDGTEVLLKVPKGYGVSPFIKVWKVLEIIFKHFGFEVQENPFRDHRQLKKLVVLNNVMDAILTGTLYYRDMMPDITIKEFLEGLFNKFGMLYFLNSSSKTVKIKFLKDIITPLASGSVEWNKLKTQEPEISYSPPKQLKLLMNREINGCEVLADTFEEFLDKYNHELTDNNPTGKSTNIFHTSSSTYSIISGLQNKVLVSSDFFDYDKKDDLEYEEIKMEDLCLPWASGRELYELYYNIKYKLLYTDMIVSNEQKGEIKNPAKPAFVFGFGIWNDDYGKYFFASQINRNPDGDFMTDQNGVKYDISLTCNREDGLFKRFWKEYDAFLRHSNFEVKCPLKLSDMDIFKLDMFKTAIINNQPLLPKQIKYKLNRKDNISECTFQTLRLYQPYNLEEEQKIPEYALQKYYWKRTYVDHTDYPQMYPDSDSLFQAGYTIPGYGSNGKYPDTIEVDGQQVPVAQLFLYPPTEEQYANKTTIEFDYAWTAINMSISFYWKINGTTHVTITPELV